MVEVGIRDGDGAHDHASHVNLTKIGVPARVQHEAVSAGPIPKDDARARHAVRNDRGAPPLNPGLDGEILQPEVAGVTHRYPITAAIEDNRLPPPPRAESGIAHQRAV